MTKSRRHIYKRPKNKTYKVTFTKKQKFIKAILKEWSKKGNYERDKMTIYQNDYYLSFTKNVKYNYNNHIHLVLKNFSTDHNMHNNILYVIKKMDKKTGDIVHSKEIKISIFSDPKKVVYNMIRRYKEFCE
jgi:hypothetical protein